MRPYLRLVLRPTLVIAASILGLVEIIFLAEKFTGLLNTVVQTGGTWFDLVRLLFWEMPEILDLALPAALLVGVHAAVGRARRDGELVVLAGTGAPVRGLVLGILLVGVLGAALSFAISGFASPAASYAQRVSLHRLTVANVARSISAPGESGTTFTTGGTDFVATGREDGPPSLMIRREPEAKPWRYAFAGDWEVSGPDTNDTGTFRLGQVTAFGDLPGLTDAGAEAQLNRMAAGRVQVGFEMQDVLPALDRNPRANELPVLPLIKFLAIGGAIEDAIDPRRVALAWARALLVPAAALLALMAVWGGTVRQVRAAALPFALVGLVLTDLIARAWLSGIAPGPGLFLACGVVGVAMIGGPVFALVAAGESLIRPGRG
ncbi:MAG: LptF/LptG family permease [Pseudooceanicola sp.]